MSFAFKELADPILAPNQIDAGDSSRLLTAEEMGMSIERFCKEMWWKPIELKKYPPPRPRRYYNTSDRSFLTPSELLTFKTYCEILIEGGYRLHPARWVNVHGEEMPNDVSDYDFECIMQRREGRMPKIWHDGDDDDCE